MQSVMLALSRAALIYLALSETTRQKQIGVRNPRPGYTVGPPLRPRRFITRTEFEYLVNLQCVIYTVGGETAGNGSIVPNRPLDPVPCLGPRSTRSCGGRRPWKGPQGSGKNFD